MTGYYVELRHVSKLSWSCKKRKLEIIKNQIINKKICTSLSGSLISRDGWAPCCWVNAAGGEPETVLNLVLHGACTSFRIVWGNNFNYIRYFCCFKHTHSPTQMVCKHFLRILLALGCNSHFEVSSWSMSRWNFHLVGLSFVRNIENSPRSYIPRT